MNAILFICTIFAVYGPTPMEIRINEGVTFALDFNNESLYASRAVGEPAPLGLSFQGGSVRPSGEDDGTDLLKKTGTQASFVDGLKGKGLCASKKWIGLSYAFKDNLTFAVPGSISLWIKPVKWKLHLDFDKSGNLENYPYQGIFSGGVVIQRAVANAYSEHKDTYMVCFPAGKRLMLSTRINVSQEQWHNLVLTWNPLVFKFYIDGKLVANGALQNKILDSELVRSFQICCPEGTIIDEIYIYNYTLTPETVKEFYDHYMKRISPEKSAKVEEKKTA